MSVDEGASEGADACLSIGSSADPRYEAGVGVAAKGSCVTMDPEHES